MGNLYSSDATAHKIYEHSGFSVTIIASISSPSNTPAGICWNAFNKRLISSDAVDNKIYIHSGFTTSITSSFSNSRASSSLRGVSIDNNDNILAVTSGTTDKYYKYTGITSTISSSFTLDADPRGISWGNDNNAYISDLGTLKHYKCSSFSNTIIASFSGTRIDGSCITYDGDIIECQLTNSKIVRYIGFTSSIRDSITSPSSSLEQMLIGVQD